MAKTIPEVFDRRADPDVLYDVIVCGGGPAGLGAALAAGVNGAKTVIFEARNQFGGTATGSNWMEWNALYKNSDRIRRGGINDLIIDEIQKWGPDAWVKGDRGRVIPDHYPLHIHPEYAKKAIFDLFKRYNIDYQLYSPVVDVVKEGDRLSGVVIGAKEGRITYKGKVTIDATGDGDVAHYAGCEMVTEGEETTHWRPFVTVSFLVCNVDTAKFWKWLNMADLMVPSFRPYRERILEQGIKKGYNLPTWIGFDEATVPGVVSINSGTSQGISVDPSKSSSLTYMEQAGIDQALDFVRWVRTERNHPGMEECYLLRVGPYALPRDTRRLVGEYVYTNDDVIKGSQFEDTVATKYGASDPVGAVRKETTIRQGAPYPYRCYLPKKTDGLLVAGRCGSATLLGHFGGKSIGNMICIGQAAGVAAALCGAMNIQPRFLDAKLIREKLDEMGVSL